MIQLVPWEGCGFVWNKIFELKKKIAGSKWLVPIDFHIKLKPFNLNFYLSWIFKNKYLKKNREVSNKKKTWINNHKFEREGKYVYCMQGCIFFLFVAHQVKFLQKFPLISVTSNSKEYRFHRNVSLFWFNIFNFVVNLSFFRVKCEAFKYDLYLNLSSFPKIHISWLLLKYTCSSPSVLIQNFSRIFDICT